MAPATAHGQGPVVPAKAGTSSDGARPAGDARLRGHDDEYDLGSVSEQVSASGTYKALGALLSYPTEDLQRAVPEIHDILKAERRLDATTHTDLDRLLDGMADGDLYDLQERYVLLFDRTRSLSLYLFEHVHGDSRDRGQAMVDLLAMYERQGLTIDGNELPDHLPIFLEFLSAVPDAEARSLLGQPLHVLIAVRERLERRDSAYAAVFRALEGLAAGSPEPEALASLRAEEDDDPNDLAALDAAWEDAPVTFGPEAPDTGCPKAAGILERILGRDGAPGAATSVDGRPQG